MRSLDGLGLDPGTKYQTVRPQYFFDYVTNELIAKYGVNTVRQGGLRVYTTINPHLQDEAQAAVNNGAASLLGGPSQALVSIDPTNGHIVAMASSGTYAERQFNLAAQGHRQPGSSFKPFVLDDGAEAGHRPRHDLLQRHQPGLDPSTSTARRGWSTTPSPAAAR